MRDDNVSAAEHGVFIIGAKSIGQYGGYETFIDKLTEYHQDNADIRYYIAVKENGSGSMDERELDGVSGSGFLEDGKTVSFMYHGAKVFKLHVPEVGPASAILYDLLACRFFLRYCREHQVKRPVFYILACRIGPFIAGITRRVHALEGKVYVNPDGHEWKRSKWSAPVRQYWKYSERLMVKQADLLVCDARAIESYIREEYGKYDPRTCFISYGADIERSTMRDDDPMFLSWLKNNDLQPFEYDLVVGRFVPENNYMTMIREYMKSRSKRKLVLITNENKSLYTRLNNELHFSEDERIVFPGPLYHAECLKKIRENAFLYLHGHSVGGTNPSLLEALSATQLNLLFDVSFNREVAENAAFYWTLEEGNLSALLDRVDRFSEEERSAYGEKARERIRQHYSWTKIAGEYKALFEEA